ncbi:MAG: class I SAM-dependent methyltransferase [Chitinophagales bacterium]
MNFNRIAPFYDFLGRLIFGRRLLQAQYHFLAAIPEGAEILVLGGGTGAFLTALDEDGVKIDFVEPSAAMMERAQRRFRRPVEDAEVFIPIRFIEGTHEQIPLKQYDAVITFFVFDVLGSEALHAMIAAAGQHLKPGGCWLVADFMENEKTAWHHRMAIKLMYLFFGLIAGVKGWRIPDYSAVLAQHGMKLEHYHEITPHFISTAVWRKVS